MSEYVFSEEDGEGSVTVEGTAGLTVRVIGGISHCNTQVAILCIARSLRQWIMMVRGSTDNSTCLRWGK